MKLYGLIGKTLKHSFSKKYFTEKFEHLGISNCTYELFELPNIEDFKNLTIIRPNIVGLNVTIPYKEQIIPFLDTLDASAEKVGAVNVIKFDTKNGKTGFNSDYYGFKKSLLNFFALNKSTVIPTNALILGTGGASKAVAAALKDLGILFQFVSRDGKNGNLTYAQLNKEIIEKNTLIVNSSPLGTFPQVYEFPDIPYEFLGENHFLFDLVYNPGATTFMNKGIAQGAKAQNGLEMLHLQAEKAWEIWND
jgi:shikimate dehydrogenase